jgi:hypothetical protein
MTAEAMRGALEEVPFQPFQLRLPNGRVLPVPHPEMVSLAPTGRIAIVWRADSERFSTVDLLLVSDLEHIEPDGSKKKRRKR